MPTLAPGSRRQARKAALQQWGPGGFTLLELLIVITVIALSTGLSVLALRDSSRDRLEQEAARLSALLEAARVESRTSELPITWRPSDRSVGTSVGAGPSPPADFLFDPPVHSRAGHLSSAKSGAASNQITTSGVYKAGPMVWPARWLHEGTQAEVIGAPILILGPEPLIPPQRVRLRLGDHQLILASDGLGAFRVEQ